MTENKETSTPDTIPGHERTLYTACHNGKLLETTLTGGSLMSLVHAHPRDDQSEDARKTVPSLVIFWPSFQKGSAGKAGTAVKAKWIAFCNIAYAIVGNWNPGAIRAELLHPDKLQNTVAEYVVNALSDGKNYPVDDKGAALFHVGSDEVKAFIVQAYVYTILNREKYPAKYLKPYERKTTVQAEKAKAEAEAIRANKAEADRAVALLKIEAQQKELAALKALYGSKDASIDIAV